MQGALAFGILGESLAPSGNGRHGPRRLLPLFRATVFPARGPSALVGRVPGAHAWLMAWFFRAIETAQGRWECRHGALVFDEHLTLADALEHLRALAAEQSEASQLFVHTLDGQVRWEGAT